MNPYPFTESPNNAKQFILRCAGLTAGLALMLLGTGNHWLLTWCGVTIISVTSILTSSEGKAARSAPFVAHFLLCLMLLVVLSIYEPPPPDSGINKPPTWYVIFMVTLWAACFGEECWAYFRRRPPKDDDHVV
jgi:hypothetical protein